MALEVNDTHEIVQYTAGGGAVNFAVPFEFFADADIKAYLTPNGSDPDDTTDILVLTTDYTLTGAGVTGGGTLSLTAGSYPTGATANDVVTIRRDLEVKRTNVDYQANGKMLAAAFNEDADRIVMMVQQLESFINQRMIKLNDTDTTSADNMVIPNITTRKGKYLYFDATTGQLAVTAAVDLSATTVSAFMDTLLDDIDADAALTTLGAVGKNTVWVPAAAMRPTVTAGCAAYTDVETTAGNPDIGVLDFDGAGVSKESAQFTVAFPKSWNKSTVTARFFWTVSSAVTTTVNWEIKGVAVSDDDGINTAYGTAQEVTDTALNAANDLHVSAETSGITIAGTPLDGDACYFRISRDPANDTMSQDARLLGVQLFYVTDTGNDA